MAETLLFPSLFASTRVQDQPCALNQTDNRGLDLGLSLGSIDYDPWFIKKKLKVSDLGDLSRLLVPKRLTKKHGLPFMHKSLDESVHRSNGGVVTVYDSDMKTKHELVFKYWPSSESYVMQRNWKKDFVNVRKLKEGDLIWALLGCSQFCICIFASSTSSGDRHYSGILEELNDHLWIKRATYTVSFSWLLNYMKISVSLSFLE